MSQSRLIVIAVVLAAVLITAITLLASKPEPVASVAPPATSQAAAPAAPTEEETNQIEWREAPIPGPLETVFQDAKGADVTLASYKGKVVVVNFWATWCAPCVKEMPTLNALQAAMGGDKLQVIAISQDREGAKVTVPFIAKNNWKNVTYYDEPKSRFQRDAQLRGLPTTIILNQKGEEVGRLEGVIDWMRADVKEGLTRVLASGG